MKRISQKMATDSLVLSSQGVLGKGKTFSATAKFLTNKNITFTEKHIGGGGATLC